MGSFANCIGFRLFNDNIKITKSRSVCFNCFHKLNVLDLIPIISYIFLKGKCRYCKTKKFKLLCLCHWRLQSGDYTFSI